MDIQYSKWIRMRGSGPETVPVFRREFGCDAPVARAELEITAAGVYEATLNGQRVGDFILAPGWTEYDHRIQVQTYDVTPLLGTSNRLDVVVGRGWFRHRYPAWTGTQSHREHLRAAVIACLHITYADGRHELIRTDEGWTAAQSNVLMSSIYDGETVDARIEPCDFAPAEVFDYPVDVLIPQQGCDVTEQETVFPCRVFRTPRGERVIDFGQNLTGYMAFEVDAHAGERLVFSTAEVMDRDGNFYNENYRTARSMLEYTCREGHQAYKPRLTFFGFRYLRVDEAPAAFDEGCVRAIVVHSRMERTGWLSTDDPLLDQLFQNILWGQKGNFLDVPTDCPQRDERMGWTGDAQVFIRTASYNYDVRRFFRKWLADVALAQEEDGWVPEVVPNMVSHRHKPGSAAWCDAVTICPWQLYWSYGEVAFLANQFDSMRKWVDYITGATTTPDMWTGGIHYDDWLGLDAPPGSYKGATRSDLIATAFYARSTELVARAGRILGRDVAAYEQLHARIVAAFKRNYADNLITQTEKVLAVHFHLTDEPQRVADALAQQIIDCGTMLQTGFVGTAYVLHVLSDYGHAELAYSLLLRREYPSWLFSVRQGATTVWEHWDGIREDGSFWSADMNSYNHYAYGCVADWVYGVACGIRPAEPGFARAIIAPVPDSRLGRLSAKLNTPHGEISCAWRHTDGRVRYDITTCVDTKICIEGRIYHVGKGSYVF